MWRFLSTCSSCLFSARGDWVDDQETGYKSDYDLLVVVENEQQVNDLAVWGTGTEGARDHWDTRLCSSFTTSSS